MRTKIYALFLMFFCFLQFASAQTHIWNGNGGDLSWSNAANWDVGAVPTASSSVLIPDGFDVEISANPAVANAIEMEGTGHLTLANSLTLGSEIFISVLSELTFQEGVLSGGIIENSGTITVVGIGANRTFNNIIINNAGLFLITESNQTIILDTTINNLSQGVIDIPSNGGLVHQNTSSTLNNAGLIKKSQGSSPNGTYYFILTLNNTGTFEVFDNQTVLLLASQYEFNNFEEGKMIGSGTYDITAIFTNMGTVYPGNLDEVGTMDVVNNFNLNEGTIEVDLAGVLAGEFDLLRVVGAPDMTGNLKINLLFAPEINDEFTIITSQFALANCNIPPETTAAFNGVLYSFDIICNQNDVTLRVTDSEILGVADFIVNETNFYVQPNPVSRDAHFIFSSESSDLNSQKKSVQLYNLTGQKVKTLSGFSETNNGFNRGSLKSGIYFAQLISEGSILATTKLILK